MENILLNFEKSKELVYIVNYIVNDEMRIKEFKSMKSATTFARKCRNFRRMGARCGYDGLYHLCEARDLDVVYNFAHRRKQMSETKKVQKCAWCKREGEMRYAAIRGPRRYFCSDTCLHKWEWFNRNGQDWLNVKETNNGEKKN